MVRRGVLGLLLLCVPQILGGGDAKDRAPRRGEFVRNSAVKPVDGHPSRPIRTASVSDRPGKADELTRFRVVTSDGILVIYDAAIPPGTNQSRDREGADRQNRERERPADSDNPGFVAYWNDFDTEQLYVFDRLLLTLGDVVVAVASLERDFVLDPDLFASDDLGVSRLSSIPPATKEGARGQSSHEATEPRSHEGGGAGTIDDGSWEPASRELVLAVMGFSAEEDGSGGVAAPPWPCWIIWMGAIEPLPRPPPGASPDDVLQLAVASAWCPPGGCTDPCCWVSCGDDNSCTRDYCISGICVHQRYDDGTACQSDGNTCTDDICVAGECTYPPLEEGTACDDDDPCTTENDWCFEGICTGCPFATMRIPARTTSA